MTIVTIDGDIYVPAYESPTPGVLDCPMEENDAGAPTIREYLIELLATLWQEQEGFSGKRPFGNSSWDMDLHKALVRGGFVKGTFDDDDEYLDTWDRAESDQQIALAIRSLK